MESYKKEKTDFVPWFNCTEWNAVRELIYGEGSTVESKQKALDVLKIWKLRIPLLQSGAEGTLIILGAILTEKDKFDSYNARLIKSTSVMRFLNICAANDKRQGTFYQVARRRKIPEWIISLRHDAAHNQNLPMEDLLDNALAFCLDWLHKNYWQPVSSHMRDYVADSDKNNEYQDLKSTLEPYITNYAYVNISMHPYWNYTTIGSISDVEVRSSIKNDISLLLENEQINDKTKLTNILHLLWVNIEKIYQSHNAKRKNYVIPELLLEGDIFLCHIDHFNDIFNEPEPTKIPKPFLFLWRKLLKNIQNYGMLPALLEKLLQVVNNNKNACQQRRIAALWLGEIGKSLNKCLVAQQIYESKPTEIGKRTSFKQLNLQLKNECEEIKPQYKHILTLNLLSAIPEMLTNMDSFKTLILTSPNEYTQLFLPTKDSSLLGIYDASNNKQAKNKIMTLVNLYVNVNGENNSSNIYTIEDLISSSNSIKENILKNYCTKQVEEMDTTETNDHDNAWEIVKDIDFSKCPLGLLPWQTNTCNPLLHL